MTLWKTLGVAVKALRRNPTRALLTALGIVIGIAAVIAMMDKESRRRRGGTRGAFRALCPRVRRDPWQRQGRKRDVLGRQRRPELAEQTRRARLSASL